MINPALLNHFRSPQTARFRFVRPAFPADSFPVKSMHSSVCKAVQFPPPRTVPENIGQPPEITGLLSFYPAHFLFSRTPKLPLIFSSVWISGTVFPLKPKNPEPEHLSAEKSQTFTEVFSRTVSVFTSNRNLSKRAVKKEADLPLQREGELCSHEKL